MEAVFALADRITVLVYGRVIASGAPDGDPRQRGGAAGLSRRAGGGDAMAERSAARARRRRDLLRPEPGAVRHVARDRAGRDGHADGPQRHGQDHDRALDHGPHAGARRHRSASPGEEIRGLPSYRIAQLGIGLVPEGRQMFPNLTVRENLVATAAEPQRRRRTLDARTDLRAVSAAGRAARQHGQPAFRRRAADAGDRPRADDQPAPADPRRGDRGPRAADPRGDLALPDAAQGATASRSW